MPNVRTWILAGVVLVSACTDRTAPPPFLPPFDFFKRLIEEELGLQAKAAGQKKQ